MALKTVERLAKIEKTIVPKTVIDIAYPVFVNNTPVDTGNARRNTKKFNDEIRAQYPYSRRLDQGWSKKSPNGMTKPTLQAIRDYIKKTLG